MRNVRNRTYGVMRRYSLAFRFSLLCQFLFLLPICFSRLDVFSFNLYIEVTRTSQFNGDVFVLRMKLPIGVVNLHQIKRNTKFVHDCLVTGAIVTFSLWLWVLLIMSGDVHPNPGPASTSSISTSSSSLHVSIPFPNSFNLFKHLSFIHYNVQSIANKIDLITTELADFDILAFSET